METITGNPHHPLSIPVTSETVKDYLWMACVTARSSGWSWEDLRNHLGAFWTQTFIPTVVEEPAS